MPLVTPYPSKPLEIKTLQWSKTMTHLAKSPNHATDFIGSELPKLDGPWQEESWKRGSEYPAIQKITPVKNLSIENTTWTSSQDHSKWAVSPHRLWIGDLNHMRSQEKRGGGGIVITNRELANAFQALVKG
jgi:hypothetical protein